MKIKIPLGQISMKTNYLDKKTLPLKIFAHSHWLTSAVKSLVQDCVSELRKERTSKIIDKQSFYFGNF